jgi:hypothetical protein
MLEGIGPGEPPQATVGPAPPVAALVGLGAGDGLGDGDGDGDAHADGVAPEASDGVAAPSVDGQSLGVGVVWAMAVAGGGCDGRVRTMAAVPPASTRTGAAITATSTGRGRLVTRCQNTGSA